MKQEREQLAIIGCAGVPARYGGFETLAHHLVRELRRDYRIGILQRTAVPLGGASPPLARGTPAVPAVSSAAITDSSTTSNLVNFSDISTNITNVTAPSDME